MKRIHKIWLKVRNTIDPLPTLDTLVANFQNATYGHLSRHQIRSIIQIVLEGTAVSRDFGLFIDDEDLNREIIYWLSTVNFFGGPDNIIKEYSWERLISVTTEAQDILFHNEFEKYFKRIINSEPKIVEANNAFNCHILDVRVRVLRAIFDKKLPSEPPL